MSSFFDIKPRVMASMTKNIPRVRNAITKGGDFDSKAQRASRKLNVSLGVVSETFLKAKRETQRGKKPDHKTEVTVEAYLEFLMRTIELTGEPPIDIPAFLLGNLTYFSEVARHDIFRIFNFLNRHSTTRPAFTAKLLDKTNGILQALMDGFDDEDTGSKINEILSEFIREKKVASMVLNDKKMLSTLFTYMQSKRFELTANSFKILHTLLFKHPEMSSAFLQNNFDTFVGLCNRLLTSRLYITLRQSLQLLGEVLLTRSNSAFMMKYTASKKQLMVTLQSLSHKQPTVVLESFHIFKIFVANPRKTKDVHDLLFSKKEVLLKLLRDFHGAKSSNDAESFQQEKAICIRKMVKLISYDDYRAKKRAAKAAKAKKLADAATAAEG